MPATRALMRTALLLASLIVHAALSGAPARAESSPEPDEGAEYRREAVQVALAGGEPADAWTYIWLDAQRLSGQPWQSEAFRLREFLQAYPPAAADPHADPGS